MSHYTQDAVDKSSCKGDVKGRMTRKCVLDIVNFGTFVFSLPPPKPTPVQSLPELMRYSGLCSGIWDLWDGPVLAPAKNRGFVLAQWSV